MTLTKTLKLTPLDDLDFSSGGLVFIDGDESLAQRIKTRLQTFRGECFLSPSTGTPWLTQIFAGGIPSTSTLNAAMISSLDTVDGIRELSRLEYELERRTRGLEIELGVNSESGQNLTINVGSTV